MTWRQRHTHITRQYRANCSFGGIRLISCSETSLTQSLSFQTRPSQASLESSGTREANRAQMSMCVLLLKRLACPPVFIAKTKLFMLLRNMSYCLFPQLPPLTHWTSKRGFWRITRRAQTSAHTSRVPMTHANKCQLVRTQEFQPNFAA